MNYKTEPRSEIINVEYMKRHRKWGKLPMIDIDSIEFDGNSEPIIWFELKHGSISNINLNDSQFKKIRNTALILGIPAFCTVYYIPGVNEYNNVTNEFGDKANFYVIPVNISAKSYLFNGEPMKMTEQEYVTWIYKIKGQPMPDDLVLDNQWNNKIKLPTVDALNMKTSTWEYDFLVKKNGWNERVYP